MSALTKKEIGAYGERVAARYLLLHGYRIAERNYRDGSREIDLIAKTWKNLVFVEVKTRSYAADEWQTAPPPSVAVHAEKQRATRQAANAYRASHPGAKPPRMDVIEVWLLKEDETARRPRVLRIRHIKGAY